VEPFIDADPAGWVIVGTASFTVMPVSVRMQPITDETTYLTDLLLVCSDETPSPVRDGEARVR
jgi:hypothetical protein